MKRFLFVCSQNKLQIADHQLADWRRKVNWGAPEGGQEEVAFCWRLYTLQTR
jgi:hypothetical protein